jgi:hypothetical protein
MGTPQGETETRRPNECLTWRRQRFTRKEIEQIVKENLSSRASAGVARKLGISASQIGKLCLVEIIQCYPLQVATSHGVHIFDTRGAPLHRIGGR